MFQKKSETGKAHECHAGSPMQTQIDKRTRVEEEEEEGEEEDKRSGWPFGKQGGTSLF